MLRLLLLCLIQVFSLACAARDKATVELSIQPEARTFSAQYTLNTRVTGGKLLLNLNKPYHLTNLTGPNVRNYTSALFFDSFTGDTLRQITVEFLTKNPRQQVTVQYNGTIAARFAADSMAEFTAHASWVPTIPNQEYAVVDYRLTVQVPDAYQVVSTRPARSSTLGRYIFEGRTSTIEIGALAARKFFSLTSPTPATLVNLYKANRPCTASDSLLVRNAGKIIAYFNQIIGRKDPIRHFTFLLPGINRSASGLLDKAAIIAYTTFDTQDPDDLLILAHEISHKWWGYGTWNTYDNWLNEAFATYSGLLYLQAASDTVSFQKELSKRQKSAATAPILLGFEPRNYPYPVRRQVLYDKGTAILFKLHQRLGDELFFRILTATAAAQVATTDHFLRIVERESSLVIRQWLQAQLSQ
ncbi:M1 family aminopeptidase [Hymenobacter sp. DG01]|uniref:M1 family aminopeptidase n=1 Tax=Hymenobacter sp. DG01 TaxID=2584940 RepID=UPI00111D597B|nr:M1 family aminopeptidase [Hymenobacter sp. DG01]